MKMVDRDLCLAFFDYLLTLGVVSRQERLQFRRKINEVFEDE